MSAVVCGKRASSYFEEFTHATGSPPAAKRARCVGSASPSLPTWPRDAADSALVADLSARFPAMSLELIEKALEESGNDLDSAIKSLLNLHLESVESNGDPACEPPNQITTEVQNAAYLILRGMKTLHLRVQCQNNTALRMAQFLEEHPKIACVYYPGLPSHPEHHIAKSQMTGFGGVVSFEVAGDFDATRKFIDSVKIPYHAPSFGGCESIIDQPAIMSYWDSKEQRDIYGIKDNLIRFSTGVEDFEDLKNDIVQALGKI